MHTKQVGLEQAKQARQVSNLFLFCLFDFGTNERIHCQEEGAKSQKKNSKNSVILIPYVCDKEHSFFTKTMWPTLV